MLTPVDFFDLSEPETAVFFEECPFVWDAIPGLRRMWRGWCGMSRRF
ncbi:MAG: hypothetical protein M5U34_08470 [Chloroflexi bacterium]|nr:hypothetical protein [Chloroflexota bacterium]